MKKTLPILCAFALVACNLRLFSTINISDILSEGHKVAMADLQVYVTSCDEESIQKIQTELNKRKITAHYNKCTQDNSWNYYANFSIPVTIMKDNNKALQTKSDIYFHYTSGKFLLRTSNRLEDLLKSDTYLSSQINISSIEFALINDTNETVKIKPTLVFIDEKPILNGVITISPYQKTLIKLSNVANKLLEQSNIVYPVFEFISETPQSTSTEINSSSSNKLIINTIEDVQRLSEEQLKIVSYTLCGKEKCYNNEINILEYCGNFLCSFDIGNNDYSMDHSTFSALVERITK